MKKIFQTFIIVLLFSVVANAQIDEKRFCPKISVNGPSGPPQAGDKIKFRATVEGLTYSEPKYEWTISSGTIIRGRGTDQIEVLVEKEGWGITATVEIPGVSKDCVAYASDTAPPLDRPEPTLLDEYESLPWKDETSHLDSIKKMLKSRANSQAYFFNYAPHDLKNDRKVKNRIYWIEKYFADEKDRLTFVNIISAVSKTKVYLIPAGAARPSP